MIEGTLIAESIRIGAELDGFASLPGKSAVRLRVTSLPGSPNCGR